MKYPKNRKYSDDVIKERILKSRNLTIKQIKENNIDFELIGSNYINKSTPTDFKCLKCGGIKIATPHNIIINKLGCTICGLKKRRTYEEFSEYCKYKGYEIVSEKKLFVTKRTKFNVNITAKFKHTECGTEFDLRIMKFLENENHCPKCFTHKFTNEEFMKKIEEIYGKDRFTLIGDYNGKGKYVQLKCNKCENIIKDFANNFIANHRQCSICSKLSLSENIVFYHYGNNIEKTIKFDDLKYKNKLSYDFRKNDIILECDGDQHFSYQQLFSNYKYEDFQLQQTRDFIKDKYALDHNFYLIRIASKEIKDNVLDIIFNSSTTIETLNSLFKNILVIKDKQLKLCKGKYKNFKIVEYIQANGNESEKDIV